MVKLIETLKQLFYVEGRQPRATKIKQKSPLKCQFLGKFRFMSQKNGISVLIPLSYLLLLVHIVSIFYHITLNTREHHMSTLHYHTTSPSRITHYSTASHHRTKHASVFSFSFSLPPQTRLPFFSPLRCHLNVPWIYPKCLWLTHNDPHDIRCKFVT